MTTSTLPGPAPVRGPRVPLRVTLVALLVVLMAVGLAATGFAATSLLKGYLLDQQDGELRTAGRHASDRMAFFIGISRSVRLFLQSASLALGAYLALQNEITVGMIIAVSIITSRALAPVEQVIGHWRAFVAARQSYPADLEDERCEEGSQRPTAHQMAHAPSAPAYPSTA